MSPRILLTALLVLSFTAAFAQQPAPKSVQAPKGSYALAMERGRMLLRQGDFDEAYDLFADAVAMADDTSASTVALRLRDASAEAKSAREHFETGDLDEAEASFRHLTVAWPDLSLTFQEYLTRIAETRRFFRENAVEGRLEYAWSNKRLRSLDGNQLSKLAGARILRLDGNQLRRLPENFGQLERLETVYLQKNQLIDGSPIQNLPALEMADLSFNGLEDLDGAFRRCPSLRVVRAGFNQLKSLPRELFEQPALEELYLADNKLAELPAWVSNAANLRVLDLSNNNLQSLPAEITRLKNLETLKLAGNPISHLPEGLTKLPNLRVLDLSGTQMDATEIEDLKKQLVGCNVVSR